MYQKNTKEGRVICPNGLFAVVCQEILICTEEYGLSAVPLTPYSLTYTMPLRGRRG